MAQRLRALPSGRRKTGRQLAASRRNIRIAQQARRRRNVKRAVIAGAVVGGAIYANDRRKNVYLYHNTDKRNTKAIRKSGYLRGVQAGSYSQTKFRETVGDVFVSKDFNQTKMFGNAVVRVRMNRKEFNNAAVRDPNMTTVSRVAYKIPEGALRRGTKSIRVTPALPMQRLMYKVAFPDGTKESYGTRPTLRRKNARKKR